MQSLQNILRSKIFLFCLVLLFLNLFLRFWQIRSTPFSFTWDEMYYVAQAKSIVLSGTDLTKQWSLARFTPINSMYDEWTSLAIAPGFLLFPNDPILAAKFVPAIMGALLPFFLAYLSWHLFRSKRLFLITAVIASFNPWLFQFSRLNYDSFYSVFAYTAALSLILSKRWQLQLASLPFFIFGFFQYQGHKVVLVPFLLLVCVVLWLRNKEKGRKKSESTPSLLPILFLLASIILMFAYMQETKRAVSGARLGELMFMNKTWQTEEVDDARRLSLPGRVHSVFSNKISIQINAFVKQYLEAFELRQLFAQQETNINTFMVREYGLLHIADAFLILVGLYFLFKSKLPLSTKTFILGLIFIGPLPSAIKTPHGIHWITFRCAFLFLILQVVSAMGMNRISRGSRIIFGIVVSVYLINVATFLYQYFYRYPIYSFQNKFFADRVLSNYVLRASDRDITYAGYREFFWYSALVFNKWMTPSSIGELQNRFIKDNLQYKNLKLDGACFNPANATGSATFITEDSVPCKDMSMPKDIAIHGIASGSPADPGTPYNIFNDKLCNQYNLGTYVRIQDRKQLEIESLSDKEFCETYFVRKNFLNLNAPPEKI